MVVVAGRTGSDFFRRKMEKESLLARFGVVEVGEVVVVVEAAGTTGTKTLFGVVSSTSSSCPTSSFRSTVFVTLTPSTSFSSSTLPVVASNVPPPSKFKGLPNPTPPPPPSEEEGNDLILKISGSGLALINSAMVARADGEVVDVPPPPPPPDVAVVMGTEVGMEKDEVEEEEIEGGRAGSESA